MSALSKSALPSPPAGANPVSPLLPIMHSDVPQMTRQVMCHVMHKVMTVSHDFDDRAPAWKWVNIK
jgi:hypothetical protein